MAIRLWVVTLALAALLIVDRGHLPICEHMAESPDCSQMSNVVCGTDGVTYNSECQLCLARIKTKQDIQIVKDGKC
ncbi:serine protease inhibitor Kazal-type 4 [Pteropus vampyrus]|uniref:Serine protease inhibitor Kazal-type 4 n=1 Tax=Pteropus vampyrus TaxID=132908 RepID=A0A6P3RDX3_PTEVA|nr:serine protease inhibitor Kazal-type 4 [Pteropus vampyrus]